MINTDQKYRLLRVEYKRSQRILTAYYTALAFVVMGVAMASEWVVDQLIRGIGL